MSRNRICHNTLVFNYFEINKFENWNFCNWKLILFFKISIEHLLLKRYVHSVDGDLDAARALIKKSFQLRNESDDIFLERDPLSEAAQINFEACAFVPLPKLTKDGHKIYLWKTLDVKKVSIYFVFNFIVVQKNIFVYKFF